MGIVERITLKGIRALGYGALVAALAACGGNSGSDSSPVPDVGDKTATEFESSDPNLPVGELSSAEYKQMLSLMSSTPIPSPALTATSVPVPVPTAVPTPVPVSSPAPVPEPVPNVPEERS